jgi:Fe-S-cluster containining protein
MECRPGCAACCIAPSISSPIPGMPQGKPAGVRCVQLTDDGLCRLFDQPERPPICRAFRATTEVCGSGPKQALEVLEAWEKATRED